MRLVLDANQFVSAVLVGAGNPARILDAWQRGEVELLVSEEILAEVRRVLLYPRLRRRHGWDETEVDAFVDGVRAAAIVTPGVLQVRAVIDDPTDDKYLACAAEGSAAYVVTGDAHLLRLGTWQGIPIVPPAAFVASELPGPAEN